MSAPPVAADAMTEAEAIMAAGAAEAQTPTKPRLLITRMEMENFKSYYGVQSVGPFHKCFSSVVGPNGSGKSNVIDAMLFVFGYRAKRMRQDKLASLIHSSEKHLDLDSCRVTVFFQDIVDKEGDEYEFVPGTELEVTRQAFRAGTSSYYVNGKKMSFKEVGQILRTRGIDLDHNRFLILQGEVEQIAMMQPKAQSEHEEGLLEYLEDIIGSDRFKEQIAKMEVEVEALSEKRNEHLNRVKAVEKEKDDLEADKKEAERVLAMQNELTVKQAKLFQFRRFQVCQEIEKANTMHAEVQEKFDALLEDMKERLESNKAEEEEYKNHVKELAKLEKTVTETKNEFAAFERKYVQYKEDLKHATKKADKLTKTLKTQQSSLGQHASKVTAAQDDIARFEKEIAGLNESLEKEEAALEAIFDSLKGKTHELQQKLEAKELELQPLSAVVNEAKGKVDIKRSELEILRSNVSAHQARLDETEKNLQLARTNAVAREEEIAAIKARRPACEKELKAATKELAALEAAEQPLNDKVKQNRARVEECKASSQQTQSRSKVLEALLKQCKSGKVSNVYGRLGDLGAIDDKYDCAVTTACGALNNIVVQTVQEAQWCVAFLRKHNLGRATFIILEKIEETTGGQMKAAFKGPADAPRLFDLITPKHDRFKVAFYHALRNTLVAKDLDEATRIAFEGKSTRHRVVSLQGQLIDTSGTMSGGGNKPMRGGMSSVIAEEVSPAEIEAMEADLEKDMAQLQATREQRRALEGKIAELEKEISQFDTRLKKATMDIKAMGEQEQELTAQLKELNAQTKNIVIDKAAEQKMEAALASAEKELEKAKKNAGVVEEQVKAIEEAIADVGGVRLRSQKAKVEGLREQIATMQGSLTKAKVALKTSERTVTKTEKEIAKTESEIEATTASKDKLMNDFKGLEDAALEVKTNYDEALALLQEKKEDMQGITKAHEERKAAMTKFESTKLDMEHKLMDLSKNLEENQSKAKQWTKKIKGLKLHRIGRDEDDEEDEQEGAEPEQKEQEEPQEGAAAEPAPEQAEAPAAMQEDEAEEQDPAAKKPRRVTSIPELSEEELAALDVEGLMYEITVTEEKLANEKPDMRAIQKFYKKEEEYLGRVAELDSVTAMRDQARAQYEDLRKQRLDTFMAGFSVITMKLKEMYQMITLGGDAELELVDRLNPFSEGIVFSVRPPKKSWKNISNLSGGEKTLSSLALVFALHHYKPTPLYVMDEIDAALDFKNVSIVANYIKERTKNAQFIIISLRNNMFELADRLVGIYKTDNCTKTVTINPVKVAARASEIRASMGAAAASATESACVAAMAADAMPAAPLLSQN